MTTVRTAPVWVAVIVTVTPGSTAPLASVILPTIRDSVCWAATGAAVASANAPYKTKRAILAVQTHVLLC